MDLPANPTPDQLFTLDRYLQIQKQSLSSVGYGKRNYYKNKKEIIGKKLVIFQNSQKKSDIWYMRFYIGNRKYKTLSLHTGDEALAIERALDKWRFLQNHLDSGGTVFEQTINESIDEYIKSLDQLVNTGQLKKLTMTCKVTSLKKLKLYLSAHERPSEIPFNAFDNYVAWRRTKNWDRSKHKNNLSPPTDQTINKELSDFKGFFDWLNRTKKYGLKIELPFLKIDWKKSDQKNPSFDVDDWIKIVNYMPIWARREEGRKEYGIFYRRVFCEFLKLLANSGLRPHEALLLRWSDIVIRKKEEVTYQTIKLKPGGVQDKLIRLGVSLDSQHDSSRVKNEYVDESMDKIKKVKEKLIAHIHVSPHTKTGRRLVICPAGLYFKRIRNLYSSKIGKAPSENDFVFMNIGTSHSKSKDYVGRPLTIDHLRKLWYELIDEMKHRRGVEFENNYTIYSCRSFFINQRLELGVKPHFVAKLVGHSIKTMERHYEDIQLRKLEPELVEVRKKKLEEAEFELYDLE